MIVFGESGVLWREIQENLEDFFAEVALEVVEELLRLGAIFDERVALTDGAPMNAFAKVLHIFEMLHPKGVEDFKIDFAFNFAHLFFADFLFLEVVGFFDSNAGEMGAVFFFADFADFVD